MSINTATDNETITIENETIPSDVSKMDISDCVSEYLSLQVHIQRLRTEARIRSKRLQKVQSRMCSILKEANKTKIDVNKEFSFVREIYKQQVPFTKKNIRSTLEKNISDVNTVDTIYKILTEKRELITKERLLKKKYREH
jgi:hypothetical protein